MVNKHRSLLAYLGLIFIFIGFMVFPARSGGLDQCKTLSAGSDVFIGSRTSLGRSGDASGFGALSKAPDGFIVYKLQPNIADGLLGHEVLTSCGEGFAENPVALDTGKAEELKMRLEREIWQSGAEVGLALMDLESGEELLIHAEEVMHAASLMKVPVMIEVFKQAARGNFALEDKILVENRFKSIVDGSPYSLLVADDSDDDIYRFIGKELSIRDLVERMITVSSNLATNILIELVGVKNVMETMGDLGIRHMEVLRGVEDIKAYEQRQNNKTDALSMMQVMLSIVEGKAGSADACQEMIEILAQQKFRAKIPAGIPEGVRVANKTGSITRIDHDAAIVFPEGQKPYVLVVLTRGMEMREDAEQLIAKLSRLVYEYLAVN